MVGSGEDVGDGHRAEIGIIKLNDDTRPQDALTPLLGHEPCFVAIYAACNCLFNLLADKGFLRRLCLFAERVRRRGLAPV
jgi:hypothetical protein